jgi:hypothetical protein
MTIASCVMHQPVDHRGGQGVVHVEDRCQRLTSRRHSGSWQYGWFHCRGRNLRPHSLRRQFRSFHRLPLVEASPSVVRCASPMGGVCSLGAARGGVPSSSGTHPLPFDLTSLALRRLLADALSANPEDIGSTKGDSRQEGRIPGGSEGNKEPDSSGMRNS